jgi:hypothetical protein
MFDVTIHIEIMGEHEVDEYDRYRDDMAAEDFRRP